MRIVFDHGVPHALRHQMGDHEVNTAEYLGWDTLNNGELLNAAEDQGFDCRFSRSLTHPMGAVIKTCIRFQLRGQSPCILNYRCHTCLVEGDPGAADRHHPGHARPQGS